MITTILNNQTLPRKYKKKLHIEKLTGTPMCHQKKIQYSTSPENAVSLHGVTIRNSTSKLHRLLTEISAINSNYQMQKTGSTVWQRK